MFAYTMLYVFLIVYNGKAKNRFNVCYTLLALVRIDEN